MAKASLNSVAGAVTAFGLGGQMRRYWGGGDVFWLGNRTGVDRAGGGTGPRDPLSSLTGTGGLFAKLQGTTNRGHVIFVLPGSSFNVDAADWASLTGAANSFAFVGLGEGAMKPSLTWTLATSTWLLDTANVAIDNFQLNMAGPAGTTALSVAAPITVSAPGCSIRNCTGQFGIDADQLATIGITTTAAATGLTLEDNHFTGATTAEVTTFMDIIGVDRLTMRRNYFAGATSAAGVGIVRFATTASLDILLEDNTYINRKASSTAAVTGLAAVSGVSRNEHFAYLNTTSLTAWLTSPGIMTFHRPTVTNTAGETGTEVVGTVTA